MKIRATKKIIQDILKAIENGEFSKELTNTHTIITELEARETYIEFRAMNGKSAKLSKEDWTILSAYVID